MGGEPPRAKGRGARDAKPRTAPMARRREPGGPAAKHRALSQRDTRGEQHQAARRVRKTTGPHHGARAMARDAKPRTAPRRGGAMRTSRPTAMPHEGGARPRDRTTGHEGGSNAKPHEGGRGEGTGGAGGHGSEGARAGALDRRGRVSYDRLVLL